MDAVKDGVSILHDNRNVFRNDDEPVYKKLHSIFLNENITQEKAQFLKKMQDAVTSCKISSCTVPDVYSIGFSRTVT